MVSEDTRAQRSPAAAPCPVGARVEAVGAAKRESPNAFAEGESGHGMVIACLTPPKGLVGGPLRTVRVWDRRPPVGHVGDDPRESDGSVRGVLPSQTTGDEAAHDARSGTFLARGCNGNLFCRIGIIRTSLLRLGGVMVPPPPSAV